MSEMVVKLIAKGVFDKYGYSMPSLFWDVTWYVLLFFTDVSGQTVGSILNVPAVRGCLNHDDGANTLSRNVGNHLLTHTA